MPSPRSRKTKGIQSIADPAHVQKEFQTRIREEDLTEEQLLVRMRELKIWEETVLELFDVERRKKAPPEKAATWEHLRRFFTSLWWISRSFLQVKMVDHLEALTDEEKKKELKPWADARREIFERGLAVYRGDKVEGANEGDGAARSLQDPKYEYYVPEISKEEILKEIGKERADWVRFKDVICDGLRIWGFNESSQFWPRNGDAGITPDDEGSNATPVASGTTEQEKQNSVPIMFRSPYQKLMASKLILLKLDVHYMKVARCIVADNEALPETFRNAILADKSIRTLDQLLLKNDDCKNKFMNSVSGVRCALKKRGF